MVSPQRMRYQNLKRRVVGPGSQRNAIDLTLGDDDGEKDNHDVTADGGDDVINLTNDDDEGGNAGKGSMRSRVGVTCQALITHLQLFNKFGVLTSLPRYEKLRELYLDLLCHDNTDLQKVSSLTVHIRIMNLYAYTSIYVGVCYMYI